MCRLKYLIPAIALFMMLFIVSCEQANSPELESSTGESIELSEAGSQNSTANELQQRIDDADPGDSIVLFEDVTLDKQLTIDKSLTFSLAGNTLYANFAKDANDNNSAIGVVGASDVTIFGVVIDASGGTELHGINVYESTGVMIDNVSISANNAGLVVNSSEVTVNNITTAGHAWHAINVDQKTSESASLTVTGNSTHEETTVAHIWIDDISKDVSVDDVEEQYDSENVEYTYDGVDLTGRAYILSGSLVDPTSKVECKENDGWKDLGFKNQGQCIRFVNTGKDSR